MDDPATGQHEGRNSVRNTLLVALLVSLCCSILVSGTAVLLKPRQVENRLYFGGQQTVLQLIESISLSQTMESALSNLDVRFVDLSTGEYVDNYDPETFDQTTLAKDPELSELIPESMDVAGLKRRESIAMIYLLMNNDELEYLILPVYGQGMWSTIYAYLALESDLISVAGLIIREHGETPGLGDKIENPDWLNSWQGKEIDSQDQPAIQLASSSQGGAASNQVDAIVGATRSAQAVVRMVQYWLGDHGFRAYLSKLEEQSENE